MKRKILLLISLWACLSTSCTTDPLELPGNYDVYASGPIQVADPARPDEPLQAEIFAPSEDGGQRIAAGPFELVLFMPGFGATYDFYSVYTRHLASHGSIVVGMNFRIDVGLDGRHDELARQAVRVIDFALGSQSPLAGHVDRSRIAAAGHSLGGKIAFYAASLDPRITVVMALDPSNGGGPPCFISDEWCNAYPVAPNVVTGESGRLDAVHAASFVMRAAPDLFNPDPQSNAEHFFYGDDGAGGHAVGAPALYFDMGAAGHASWLYFGNVQVPRITCRTLVAWLKDHFYGGDFETYFTGEVAQRDLEQGNIVEIATR
jgi:pimeloyl-ACP methyl ester carboxylesterase